MSQENQQQVKSKVNEEACRRWIVKLQFLSLVAQELYVDMCYHGMPEKHNDLIQFSEYCENQASIHAQILKQYYTKPQIKIARPEDGN